MPLLPSTCILLAHGFDAELVTRWVVLGRSQAHPVKLVGMLAGALRSDHGISLNPDCTLEDMDAARVAYLLLPGGVRYLQSLFRDPRVLRLASAVRADGGLVLAPRRAAARFADAGVAAAENHYLEMTV